MEARDELGIRDTLLRSKEIAAIEILRRWWWRHCIAFCSRSCTAHWKAQPTSIKPRRCFGKGCQTKKSRPTWKSGGIGSGCLMRSIRLDKTQMCPKDVDEPWTKLAAEHNATTHKVLFDHTDTRIPARGEPQESRVGCSPP